MHLSMCSFNKNSEGQRTRSWARCQGWAGNQAAEEGPYSHGACVPRVAVRGRQGSSKDTDEQEHQLVGELWRQAWVCLNLGKSGKVSLKSQPLCNEEPEKEAEGFAGKGN